MDSAFKWWISNGGACDEADYAYHARDQDCQTTCSSVADSGIKTFTVIKKNDEAGLATAVENAGPISVAVGANSNWQHYKSGVFDDGMCWLTQLNHGVLNVGIEGHAWIIKNSWGTVWGENGFMRLVKGKNMCGVAAAASWPSF